MSGRAKRARGAFASACALALALLTLTLLSGGAALAQEGPPGEVAEPRVAARAWALTDLRTGEYLVGENAQQGLPIASTTKIMVALVALEKGNLDEEVVVSPAAASFAVPLYSNVGLFPGDTLTVRELLMAALIASGDDATYALAEHLGGGGEAGVDRFVAMMNEEAGRLGLKDTHFENPIGLDGPGHRSSAGDLAQMTRLAMANLVFHEMVGARYATIGTQDREIPLTNTNELLFAYRPATGVKTGTTPAAGESLVAAAQNGDESYAFVVLDAGEERFAAASRVLEHGFAAYDRRDLVVQGREYARAGLPYRRGEAVRLVARESVAGLVDGDSEIRREVRVMANPPDSARSGTRIGEIVVKVDGDRVGESPLVAKRGYEEASLAQRVWYTVGGIFV